MNQQKLGEVIGWLRNHHPSDNRVRSIAAGLGISIAYVRVLILCLESRGDIKRHSERYGSAFAYVLADKAQEAKGIAWAKKAKIQP